MLTNAWKDQSMRQDNIKWSFSSSTQHLNHFLVHHQIATWFGPRPQEFHINYADKMGQRLENPQSSNASGIQSLCYPKKEVSQRFDILTLLTQVNETYKYLIKFKISTIQQMLISFSFYVSLITGHYICEI